MNTNNPQVDLLNPDDPRLIQVSPKYATVRRITDAILFGPLLLAAVIVAILSMTIIPAADAPFLTLFSWLGAALVLVLWVWDFWLIGRQVSAHRYLEGAEHFFVAKGRWWRSVTVVPYGRIQFVDLTEGPLLRAFGLARLKLNTASVTSDAAIVGIPREEAQAIRERLSNRARERMAGL